MPGEIETDVPFSTLNFGCRWWRRWKMVDGRLLALDSKILTVLPVLSSVVMIRLASLSRHVYY